MANTAYKVASILHGRYDEAPAHASVPTPSHLVEFAGGKLRPHSSAGAKPTMVALEDRLRGYPRNVWDAYAEDDVVPYAIPLSGDVLNLLIPVGQNIAKYDLLRSKGDGQVIKLETQAGDLLYQITADSATHTNLTAETAFSNGSYSIPANFLRVGDVIKVRARVRCPSTNSTDTLNIKLKIGSTIVLATGAVDVANDAIGTIEATVVVRAIGATGKIMGSGFTSLGIAGSAAVLQGGLSETTLDTTAAAVVAITATWSALSTSDQVILDVLNIDLERNSGFEAIAQADEAVDNSAGSASTRVLALWL